jgi:hypothetical protein
MDKIVRYKDYFHESSLDFIFDVSSLEPSAKRMKYSDQESTNIKQKEGKVNCKDQATAAKPLT